MDDKQLKALEEQSASILRLISDARQLDLAGKMIPARHKLISARMKVANDLGQPISSAKADQEVQQARKRIRKAAEAAERKLRCLMYGSRLWDWTDPDRCLRELREQRVGPGFGHLPLTDIEEGLKSAGNVLWIMAVYPALEAAIQARLYAMRATQSSSKESLAG